MLLSDISKIINVKKIINLKNNKSFNKISFSSKNINKNTIFVTDFNKNIKFKYIQDAITNNIAAILTNKIIKKVKLTQIVVNNLDEEVNKLLLKLKKNEPINSIAITGTNGKTTVSWFVSEICRINKIKIKMQGTLGYYINGRKIKNEELTTPDYATLHQNGFSNSKNTYNYIFEASSHSLAQNRIKNFPINIAAITNISHDHLDYHKSINNYINSKFKLFEKFLNNKGIAIINSRLTKKKKLIKLLKKQNTRIKLYGKKNIFISKEKNKSYLNINSKKYFIKNLPFSSYDIENLECAIACCLELNIKPKNIIKSLNILKSPPGRSEVVNFKKKSSKIIIDYAHTPEALRNILKTNTFNKKKPLILFGCGGNRDKAKRKLMGQIASKFADKVIITDDNPRNENPKIIRLAILKYCPNGIEIPNRKIAIIKTIKNLENKSVLIIAGKGHENKQILANKTIYLDDLKITKQTIKNVK